MITQVKPISLGDKRAIHKNRRLLAQTLISFDPINEEHHTATLYLLKAGELFGKLCDQYPLKHKK